MSTSDSFKNLNIFGLSGAFESALVAQDIAARLVQNSIPQIKIARGLVDTIAKSAALNLVAQQATIFKGLEANWMQQVTPQLSIASGLVGASIGNVLGQVSLGPSSGMAWMKNLPDMSGILGLQPQPIFGDLGSSLVKQWASTFATLNFDLLNRRILVPYNWPDDFEEYLLTIQEILNNEGLPIAWVPRQSILLRLFKAKSAEKRLNILRKYRDEVLEDCAKVVEEMDDVFLADQIPLSRDVIAACRDGHWTAGAALAVDITHGIVEKLEWHTNPKSLKAHYTFSMNLTLKNMITGVTQASLVSFYEEWHPKSPKPAPKFLTRNMVSHNVTQSHLNEHNCLVAVMLMASVMETVYQLELGRTKELAA